MSTLNHTPAKVLPHAIFNVHYESTQLQEAPIALCINGVCQSVMMATPSDLEAFARGFAISEGLVRKSEDILYVDCASVPLGWQVDITVLAASEKRLKQQRRFMAGPSGCGLCGVESIEAAMVLPNQGTSITATTCGKSLVVTSLPSREMIEAAVRQLPELQKQFDCTRGHHGAAFFNLDNQLIELAEDVGRHSALDKLIGRLSMDKTNQSTAHTGFALLTSRCSHDLVMKASRAAIPVLVTLAPPTDLAVQTARQLNLPLFCQQQGKFKQFA